jgi:hypothetical protein
MIEMPVLKKSLTDQGLFVIVIAHREGPLVCCCYCAIDRLLHHVQQHAEASCAHHWCNGVVGACNGEGIVVRQIGLLFFVRGNVIIRFATSRLFRHGLALTSSIHRLTCTWWTLVLLFLSALMFC